MRAEKFFGCLTAVTLALMVGCAPTRNGSGGAGASGSGGSDPAGGTSSAGRDTGGSPGSGGVTDTGGSPSSGGTSGSAGATATGGVSMSGGTTGAGGHTGTGGVSTSGGATGTGGRTGTGGASMSGGTTGTGGHTGTGGTSAAGGAGGGGTCAVTSSIKWSSTASLMNPVVDDSHKGLIAIMSPTVVSVSGKYHLYATVVDSAGNSTIQYFTFADWTQAGSVTAYFLDNTAGFSGSHAAPQLLYITAQKKWYLVLSQSGGPAYSTASDPGQPSTWTKPTTFFSSTPTIVTQNAGTAGVSWSDFWVICDSTNCHMFFTNQNGYLFRSQTSIGNFPNSFGTPVVVMHSDANSLYEATNVYKIKGTSKYLLLLEAVGSTGRYLRSWTADAIDGTWTVLADSEASPFAGYSNVTFSGTAWSRDIANGEAIRDGYDETMTINPCNLQFVYQGKDPYATATGNTLPWKLGLLTRTN